MADAVYGASFRLRNVLCIIIPCCLNYLTKTYFLIKAVLSVSYFLYLCTLFKIRAVVSWIPRRTSGIQKKQKQKNEEV